MIKLIDALQCGVNEILCKKIGSQKLLCERYLFTLN